MKVLLLLFILTTTFHVWGHGGEDHSKNVKQPKAVKPNVEIKEKYIRINQEYLKTVKPIFQKSCFDCHGNTTVYPWYYKIPGVKQLIDSDIKESKKHLDFSKGFPFVSHETPIKDLDAIGKSIKNDSMPPFRYLIMHGDKKLTKDEVKQVDKWIRESKEMLK
ncbi:MAG: heme-binding domain-containing protein [Halobacteriovoraceae bacterium]|nr:heme-binding domain-containing protein [Halobacteriovoraceae bacterium]